MAQQQHRGFESVSQAEFLVIITNGDKEIYCAVKKKVYLSTELREGVQDFTYWQNNPAIVTSNLVHHSVRSMDKLSTKINWSKPFKWLNLLHSSTWVNSKYIQVNISS